MLNKYKTVKQIAESQTVFTESALRNLIFYARFNGMEEHNVIHRVGGKILINEENFAKWIELNPKTIGVRNVK